MNQEKIGKIIKENRIKNNLTQNDLAIKLGVTYQAVSKWENGKNIPDIALLKEICELFDLDLNELLGGKKKNKSNKKTIIFISISVLIVAISIITLIVKNKSNDLNMKEIKSNCNKYDITGVVAYTNSKSSIYISNINYCGKKSDIKYKKIQCNLYEELNNKITKIKSCKTKYNITLDEYLKDIKINVDNYSSMCTKFNKSSLYLEIETENKDNINKHKIPLKLESNCN